MNSLESPVSLYIHIPFCTHRCAYCDFNTYAGQEEIIPAYVDALCKEIEFVGSQFSGEVHTIFFGGGTPSLLSPLQFAAIFKAIRANFMLTSDAEITIEANPGTVTEEALCQLREIGVNRISFGVQSANAFELKMLERSHSFFDFIEAITSARKAGFDNLNLDLIYGLPEQTLETWQTTVRRIVDFHPEHISAYALTLEHGTPFGRWASKGLLPLPNPDLAAEMYEWVSDALEANGYANYEISNWAMAKTRKQNGESSSLQCRHNLQYWRGRPYLAFGAGAHGYANGYRYSNILRIKTYIDRLADLQSSNSPIPQSPISNLFFPLSPAAVNHHKQALKDDMSEFMMTGLRLTQEGISSSEFEKRFARKLEDVFGKEIQELTNLGLIESPSPGGRGAMRCTEPIKVGEGRVLRLSKRGRLLGNRVFIKFVSFEPD